MALSFQPTVSGIVHSISLIPEHGALLGEHLGVLAAEVAAGVLSAARAHRAHTQVGVDSTDFLLRLDAQPQPSAADVARALDARAVGHGHLRHGHADHDHEVVHHFRQPHSTALTA
jgi:hypothetical protein